MSYEYTDPQTWPTPNLEQHIRTMLLEKEIAVPHKATELEHAIGYAVFELWSRRQEEAVTQPA